MFNGKLISKDFSYEEKNKILINNFNYKDNLVLDSKNSLYFLNNALATGGFSNYNQSIGYFDSFLIEITSMVFIRK